MSRSTCQRRSGAGHERQGRHRHRRLAGHRAHGRRAARRRRAAISPILARDLPGRDITVNAVAPGPTATALFLGGKDAETIDRMARMNPMDRPGTPEDIAEAVSFRAGPGRWVNGRTFHVNGGVA